ncbi:MAG: hypothetical protein AAB390_05300 [Patescibacteria group bacterium]
MSYLKQLTSLLPQKLNRRRYIAVFGGFLVLGLLVSASPVGAVIGYIASSILDGFLMFFTWLMLILAELCIGLTIFFLRFFISIAAYNNYIDVDVVQLGWIMIRDVANMFFVVALLVIAFGTILGIEEYEWKKNLVKLILAAILINFSNLIAQLIIDIAHVFTITFLNAIAATAGGNIINMFKLNEITQMIGAAGKDPGDLRVQLAAGALAATGFAVLAAVAMGSYAYVMMVRVVVLWGLIILAPGAYILGVLPKTKAYADRWWSEFGKHVVVAPVMVFFLWLSFATLGNGQIAQDIQKGQEGTAVEMNQKNYENPGTAEFDNPTLSLAKVTSWENMASFFIAMAFMYYGLKVTQETGATGAGAVGAALEFGKKVATIATGYAAGRWLVDGATNVAKKGAMATVKGAAWGLYHAPGLDASGRVQRGKEYFQMQWQSFEAWRNRSEGPTMKRKWNEETGRYEGIKEMREKKDEKTGEVMKDEKTGEVIMEETGKFETEDIKLGFFQKFAHQTAVKNAESAKKLEKTQKFAETRKEYLSKTTKGVPTGFLMKDFEKVDALDRYERGRLKAAGERSAAKTEEHETAGALAEGSQARFQSIVKKGWIYDSIDTTYKKETLDEEIAGHKVRADSLKKRREENTERAKKRAMEGKGKGAVEARMRAELTIKALQGETKKIEEAARFRMGEQDLDVAKETNAAIERLRDDLRLKSATMSREEAGKKAVDGLLDQGEITSKQAYDYGRNLTIDSMVNNGEISEEQGVAMKSDEGIDPESKYFKVIDKKRDELFDKSMMTKKDAEKAVLATGMVEDEEFVRQREGMKRVHSKFSRDEARDKAIEELVWKGTITSEQAAESKAGGKNSVIDSLQNQIMLENSTISDEDAGKLVSKTVPRERRITAAEVDEYRSRGEGAGVIYRAAAAEKQAHTEAEKLKELTTEKGREYAESHHGQEELEEEAVLALQITRNEEAVKQMETDKKTELLDEGKRRGEKIAGATEKIMNAVKTPEQAAAETALLEARTSVAKIEKEIKDKVDTESKPIKDAFATERRGLKKELDDAEKAKKNVESSDAYSAYNEERAKKKRQLVALEKEEKSKGVTEARKSEISGQKEALKTEIAEPFAGYGDVVSDYDTAKAALANFDTETEKAIEEVRTKVRAERNDEIEAIGLTEKSTNLEKINDRVNKSPEQIKKIEDARIEAQRVEEAALGAKGKASVALRYARQKQASATAKSAEDEAEKNLQHAALGLGIVQKLFSDEQANKLGSEAAEAFINKIKQEKIGDLFKNGAKQLDKALEKLKKGGKLADVLKEVTDKSARSVYAQTVGTYYQENVAGISKTRAVDIADDLWSFDRTGNSTPATAFKKAVNKQNEVYAGVEKERGASIAVDTIKRIRLMQSKGEKLDVDHEAALMASVQFLTKNGWSDDGLSRMVDVARSKNKQKYGTREYEEAEAMEKLLVDELGWGKKDAKTGAITFKNESSEKRTNDFHRLMGFGGDVNMLHSENAVLLHQKYMESKEGKTLSYEEAIQDLHGKTSTASGRAELAVKQRELGLDLGWDDARINRQLEVFSQKFVAVGENAGQSLHRYTEEMKKYGDQAELLTEMKSLALATTHIDDAGHSVFDMDMGYARGQLSTDAMKTMLGDWIKVDGGTKLRNLKSHAIGYMDEDVGTLHRLDASRVNSTFQGVDSKVKLEAQDVRVQRQILKNAASEELRKDAETGAVIVGAMDSVLVAKKFKGDTEKAKADVARDWAVLLKEAPKEFLAVASMNSGLEFNEAQATGRVNLNVFGEQIDTMEHLVRWINAHSGTVAEEDDRREIGKLNHTAIVSSGRKGTIPVPGTEDEEPGK